MRYEEYGYQGTPEEIARLMKLKKQLQEEEPKKKKEPSPPSGPEPYFPTIFKKRFRKG